MNKNSSMFVSSYNHITWFANVGDGEWPVDTISNPISIFYPPAAGSHQVWGERRCTQSTEQQHSPVGSVTDGGAAVPVTTILIVPQVDLLCFVLVCGMAGFTTIAFLNGSIIMVIAICLMEVIHTRNLHTV